VVALTTIRAMKGGEMTGLRVRGDVIDGRYQVNRVLRGGMGVVCPCRDMSAGLPVAVRTLKPGAGGDIRLRRAFQQEVTIWSRIPAHPNVVGVERIFRESPGGVPYVVLELVAAEPGYEDASLGARLARGGPVPLEGA
jgi:hypothetical protein